MDWKKLKQNKCPSCGKDLVNSYRKELKKFVCPCGFEISESSFGKITTNMVEQEIENEYKRGQKTQ